MSRIKRFLCVAMALALAVAAWVVLGSDADAGRSSCALALDATSFLLIGYLVDR